MPWREPATSGPSGSCTGATPRRCTSSCFACSAVTPPMPRTSIRAVRQLSKFRWESSLRTWLSAIGLNLARETLRKRARVRAEEFDERLGLAARPVRDGERIELERAIARLPNGYRTVLVLHDVEGYTHEEISRQLQIAVGTSKSQLFDARRAVRSLLQPSKPEAHHA